MRDRDPIGLETERVQVTDDVYAAVDQTKLRKGYTGQGLHGRQILITQFGLQIKREPRQIIGQRHFGRARDSRVCNIQENHVDGGTALPAADLSRQGYRPQFRQLRLEKRLHRGQGIAGDQDINVEARRVIRPADSAIDFDVQAKRLSDEVERHRTITPNDIVPGSDLAIEVNLGYFVAQTHIPGNIDIEGGAGFRRQRFDTLNRTDCLRSRRAFAVRKLNVFDVELRDLEIHTELTGVILSIRIRVRSVEVEATATVRAFFDENPCSTNCQAVDVDAPTQKWP